MLEVVKACVEEIGRDRVGMRLSPFGGFLEVTDTDPYATNNYVINRWEAAGCIIAVVLTVCVTYVPHSGHVVRSGMDPGPLHNLRFSMFFFFSSSAFCHSHSKVFCPTAPLTKSLCMSLFLLPLYCLVLLTGPWLCLCF